MKSRAFSRRQFLASAALAAATTLIAACSPKSPAASTNTPEPAAATAPPPTAAPSQPVMLGYSHWKDATQIPTEETILQQFKDTHPNVSIDMQVIDGMNYLSTISTQFAGGVMPDVAQMADQAYELVLKGAYRELQSYIEADSFKTDSIPEAALIDATSNGIVCSTGGKLYAIPTSVLPWVFYYNVDMLKEAGFSKMPAELESEGKWDYDAFRQMALACTKDTNGDGKIDQWGINVWFDRTALWGTIPFQWGGQVFSDDLTECLLNSPEVQAGMEVWWGLEFKDHVWPSPAEQTAAITFPAGKQAFQDGHTEFNTEFRAQIKDFVWDCVPWPMGPKNNKTLLMNHSFGIATPSKHADLAWELLKHLSSVDSQKLRTQNLGITPSDRRALDTFIAQTPPANNKVVTKTLFETSFGFPHFPGFDEWKRLTGVARDSVLAGEKTVKEALDILTTASNKILAKIKR